MSKNWLAVASADHVAVGRAEGFMQVCHGKVSPLRRLQPGDRVVYYSPTRRYSPSHALREKDRLQSFTALGTVSASAPYRADTDGERAEIFLPWRRDIAWHDAGEVPLEDLKGRLAFARVANWGYRLRQGLVEIGLVVLVGLAAKNAILIVEFAKHAHEAGMSRHEAAISAARTRLRPILMTSLAFILGVVPLVLSTGAGAEMRQSLGTAVFAGKLGVTLFGLLFTPVFHVISTALSELCFKWRKKDLDTPTFTPER